ncbi:hypothetical protein PR202_ga07869 [Eleusine coracana subsp. coracana]|uniref:Mediator of RNA polymerase II transcription subunit 31 n=1 Tax=Eleusine coracana subsp. coracana TaxID=191504 RepID=A0AAV5C139_ELECO|nr:hypothetical protein PR202_ga07869 [Eleusine coracana subsp. coracana]
MADVESVPDGAGKPPPYKDPDDGRQRFLLELEFVQCLANPTYIHCVNYRVRRLELAATTELTKQRIRGVGGAQLATAIRSQEHNCGG